MMLREVIALLICYGIALMITVIMRLIIETVMYVRIPSDVGFTMGMIIGVIVTFFLYDIIRDRVRGVR